MILHVTRCSIGFRYLLRANSFLFREPFLSKTMCSSSEPVNSSWSIRSFAFLSLEESSATAIDWQMSLLSWARECGDVSLSIHVSSLLPRNNLLWNRWWACNEDNTWDYWSYRLWVGVSAWRAVLNHVLFFFEQVFNIPSVISPGEWVVCFLSIVLKLGRGC